MKRRRTCSLAKVPSTGAYVWKSGESAIQVSYASDADNGAHRVHTVPLSKFPQWIQRATDPHETILDECMAPCKQIHFGFNTDAPEEDEALLDLCRIVAPLDEERSMSVFTQHKPEDSNSGYENDGEDQSDDMLLLDQTTKSRAEALVYDIQRFGREWTDVPRMPIDIRLILCMFDRR